MTVLAEHPHLRIVRQPGQPSRRPSRRGAFVVAVLVAVILALLGTLIFGRNSPHPKATPKQAASAPAVAPTKLVTSPGSCHLPDSDQAIPETAPATSWRLYDFVALPYSSTAGPEFVTDRGNVARCFAHDPTGALVADSQLGIRYLVSPAWRHILATQVVPGVGVKAYAADRATVTGAPTAGEFCQSAAFSFLSYTPRVARIEDVERCGSTLQATTTTLDWSGTDWRLALQPNGGESARATTVANLTGFVPWGGV